MFQTWHIFAVATVVFGSISSLIVRALMKHDRHDPVLSMIVFQCMLTAITLCFALYKGFVFPFPAELWPRMLLSAILYAVGSLSNFYASKHLEAGELTILNASGALVTIALGVLLIGNSFTVWNALGTVLILLSIFVLYAGEKMKMNIGVWYAIAVTVSYAVAVINDVVIIRSYSSTSFVPVMSLMPGIVIALVFYRKLPHMRVFFRWTTFTHIFVYSFFYGLSAVTFYLALDYRAPISQLSPISRASIIVTVLLSAVFLNERKELGKKILSALLVSAGVLLLA